MGDDLLVILLNDLFDVGEDQEALPWPVPHNTVDKISNDHRLATAGTDADQRIAIGATKIAINGVNGLLLIPAQFKSHLRLVSYRR